MDERVLRWRVLVLVFKVLEISIKYLKYYEYYEHDRGPDSWNSCHWSDNSHQVQQSMQYYKYKVCECRKNYRSIALTTLITLIDD